MHMNSWSWHRDVAGTWQGRGRDVAGTLPLAYQGPTKQTLPTDSLEVKKQNPKPVLYLQHHHLLLADVAGRRPAAVASCGMEN